MELPRVALEATPNPSGCSELTNGVRPVLDSSALPDTRGHSATGEQVFPCASDDVTYLEDDELLRRMQSALEEDPADGSETSPSALCLEPLDPDRSHLAAEEEATTRRNISTTVCDDIGIHCSGRTGVQMCGRGDDEGVSDRTLNMGMGLAALQKALQRNKIDANCKRDNEGCHKHNNDGLMQKTLDSSLASVAASNDNESCATAESASKLEPDVSVNSKIPLKMASQLDTVSPFTPTQDVAVERFSVTTKPVSPLPRKTCGAETDSASQTVERERALVLKASQGRGDTTLYRAKRCIADTTLDSGAGGISSEPNGDEALQVNGEHKTGAPERILSGPTTEHSDKPHEKLGNLSENTPNSINRRKHEDSTVMSQACPLIFDGFAVGRSLAARALQSDVVSSGNGGINDLKASGEDSAEIWKAATAVGDAFTRELRGEAEAMDSSIGKIMQELQNKDSIESFDDLQTIEKHLRMALQTVDFDVATLRRVVRSVAEEVSSSLSEQPSALRTHGGQRVTSQQFRSTNPTDVNNRTSTGTRSTDIPLEDSTECQESGGLSRGCSKGFESFSADTSREHDNRNHRMGLESDTADGVVDGEAEPMDVDDDDGGSGGGGVGASDAFCCLDSVDSQGGLGVAAPTLTETMCGPSKPLIRTQGSASGRHFTRGRRRGLRVSGGKDCFDEKTARHRPPLDVFWMATHYALAQSGLERGDKNTDASGTATSGSDRDGTEVRATPLPPVGPDGLRRGPWLGHDPSVAAAASVVNHAQAFESVLPLLREMCSVATIHIREPTSLSRSMPPVGGRVGANGGQNVFPGPLPPSLNRYGVGDTDLGIEQVPIRGPIWLDPPSAEDEEEGGVEEHQNVGHGFRERVVLRVRRELLPAEWIRDLPLTCTAALSIPDTSDRTEEKWSAKDVDTRAARLRLTRMRIQKKCRSEVQRATSAGVHASGYSESSSEFSTPSVDSHDYVNTTVRGDKGDEDCLQKNQPHQSKQREQGRNQCSKLEHQKQVGKDEGSRVPNDFSGASGRGKAHDKFREAKSEGEVFRVQDMLRLLKNEARQQETAVGFLLEQWSEMCGGLTPQQQLRLSSVVESIGNTSSTSFPEDESPAWGSAAASSTCGMGIVGRSLQSESAASTGAEVLTRFSSDSKMNLKRGSDGVRSAIDMIISDDCVNNEDVRSQSDIRDRMVGKAVSTSADSCATVEQRIVHMFKRLREFGLRPSDAVATLAEAAEAQEFVPQGEVEVPLGPESLVWNPLSEPFVEVAFALSRTTATCQPWRTEMSLQEGRGAELPHSLTHVRRVLSHRTMKLRHFLGQQRILCKSLYKAWRRHRRSRERMRIRNGDEFGWGVLPVRAIDHRDLTVGLPAGFRSGNRSEPYQTHQDMRDAEAAQKQGQGRRNPDASGRRTLRADSSNDRQRAKEQAASKESKREWMQANYSNLTGPAVFWRDSCLFSLGELLRQKYEKSDVSGVLPVELVESDLDFAIFDLDRNCTYICNNSRIFDPRSLEDERKTSTIWTESEARTFVEKFLMYPKNFEKIASCLDGKTTRDCVDFYYRYKYQFRLKRRLQDLEDSARYKKKNRHVGSKQIRREELVAEAMLNVASGCCTPPMSEFIRQNSLPFDVFNDYLLHRRALRASLKDPLGTRCDDSYDYDSDTQDSYIENIKEGFFFPAKYTGLVAPGRFAAVPTVFSGPSSSARASVPGCIVLDHRKAVNMDGSPVYSSDKDKNNADDKDGYASSSMTSVNSVNYTYENSYLTQQLRLLQQQIFMGLRPLNIHQVHALLTGLHAAARRFMPTDEDGPSYMTRSRAARSRPFSYGLSSTNCTVPCTIPPANPNICSPIITSSTYSPRGKVVDSIIGRMSRNGGTRGGTTKIREKKRRAAFGPTEEGGGGYDDAGSLVWFKKQVDHACSSE